MDPQQSSIQEPADSSSDESSSTTPSNVNNSPSQSPTILAPPHVNGLVTAAPPAITPPPRVYGPVNGRSTNPLPPVAAPPHASGLVATAPPSHIFPLAVWSGEQVHPLPRPGPSLVPTEQQFRYELPQPGPSPRPNGVSSYSRALNGSVSSAYGNWHQGGAQWLVAPQQPAQPVSAPRLNGASHYSRALDGSASSAYGSGYRGGAPSHVTTRQPTPATRARARRGAALRAFLERGRRRPPTLSFPERGDLRLDPDIRPSAHNWPSAHNNSGPEPSANMSSRRTGPLFIIDVDGYYSHTPFPAPPILPSSGSESQLALSQPNREDEQGGAYTSHLHRYSAAVVAPRPPPPPPPPSLSSPSPPPPPPPLSPSPPQSGTHPPQGRQPVARTAGRRPGQLVASRRPAPGIRRAMAVQPQRHPRWGAAMRRLLRRQQLEQRRQWRQARSGAADASRGRGPTSLEVAAQEDGDADWEDVAEGEGEREEDTAAAEEEMEDKEEDAVAKEPRNVFTPAGTEP
ncbi:hypothetical protein F5Y19DRAFT_329774 [Xylariaceae sp. FL1651]|nr:hypothetical protein F5Y19DRAFT_329774 [Xylariaceae sp. FL1651]